MIDERYMIRDNESEDDYELRICSYHDSEGLTWDEIAGIINHVLEKNHTESRYRRLYKAYKTGHEAGETITKLEVGIKGAKPDADPKVNAEEQALREKYINSAENLSYYRLLRQDSRFQRFYETVAETFQRLAPPNFVDINQDLYNERHTKEYVLTLADLHIGSKFEGVNNSYSIDEVYRRFNVLYTYMVKFIQDKGIGKLKILSLGDIVQGMLRITDVKLNESAVVDAFVIACRLLADFLNKLSKYCEIEFIQVCFSNHDQLRFIGTKASEFANEDLGKILFAYLTDILSLNDRVKILGDVDKDYVQFKIFDFECIALHGHQVNNIASISKDLTNRNRKFYDYVMLAHSHSAKELIAAEGEHHNIEVLVAPSFIGSCPYADKLMVGSKAGCKVFEFDNKYGHTASYNIILN